MVTVQRLYHTLPAQSTPSSAFIGHPPTTAVTAYISITKNENSYAMHITPYGRAYMGEYRCPSRQPTLGRKCLNLNQKKCKFLYDAHNALRADYGP